MKFGQLQLVHFNAEDGAFSVVTRPERDDPQITVDKFERDVVLSVLPRASILVGPKKDNLGIINPAIYKRFRSWPSGNVIDVQINFPKPDKPNELRIYIPDTDPFSPPAGDIWFVFRRAGELHIGHMPENNWRSIGRIDDEDSRYLSVVHSDVKLSAPASTVVTTLKFPVSRARARLSFRRAGYQCEVEPGIPLFVARSSGLPYLEPHHLIHRSLQPAFKSNLDHPDNIYALSPHHHMRIHYGTSADTIEIIDRLLCKRSSVLGRYGVTRDEILGFYNCLPIN